MVGALSNQTAEIRDGVTYAMRETYSPELVKHLSAYIENTGNPVEGRKAAASALAPLRKMAKPWDGVWWMTGPARNRPPTKQVDWAGTESDTNTVKLALKSDSSAIRMAAIEAMQIAPDPSAGDLLAQLFKTETESSV